MKKIWIVCISLLMSVALCFGIAGCKDSDDKIESATISVTVNGNAQTNGGTYNVFVGTAYTIATTASNEATVSVSYVSGSDTKELKGTSFTPTDEGSYVFTFNAEGAESFKLTFSAAKQSTAVEQYTVTFELGDHFASDAEKIGARTYVAGTSITLPAVKAASGYVFSGWTDGTKTYDAFKSYTVNGKVTLTAVWKAEQYAVSYLSGEHAAQDVTVPELRKVDAGTVITLPAALKADTGYIFAGWNDGTNTYEAGKAYTVNGTTTLTAIWENEQYTVSYALGAHAAQGATELESHTATINTVVKLPAAIAAEDGYEFKGWSDGTTTYSAGDNYTVKGTVSFTAIYDIKVNKVTITFVIGNSAAVGATTPEAKTVEGGATITLPAAIKAKTGYTFVGWSDGTTTYNAGATYTATISKTISAVWNTTVKYALGEHASQMATAPEAQTVAVGATITLPVAITAENGYEFAGWSNGKTAYNAEGTYTASAPVTLTAVWNIVVSYSLGGHGAQTATVPQAQSVSEESSIKLPAAVDAQNGYAFAGWTDGSETYDAEASYTVIAPVTITAVWDIVVSYSLGTHAAQDEIVPDSQIVSIGETITLPAAIAAEDGYIFVGWSDGTVNHDAGEDYEIIGAVSFTAVYEEDHLVTELTVKFALGKYAVAGTAIPASQTVEKGTEITLPAAITAQSGYIFAGWSDGTKTYDAGASYTAKSSITITAVWKTTISYSLGSYAAQGTTAPTAQTVVAGAELKLPAAIAARNGYVFAGWSDGTKTYNAATNYTVSAPVTLNAVWKIVVSYDLGEYAAQGVTVRGAQVAIGASITLPAAVAGEDGYVFAGWNNGSATYNAGVSYTVNSPVTFTAVWNIEVSYDLGDHAAQSANAPQSQTVAIGNTISLPAAIAPAFGYLFDGWSDGTNKYAAGSEYEVNSAVSFTVVWKEIYQQGGLLNGNFETGDLTGWTIVNGNAETLTVTDAITYWADDANFKDMNGEPVQKYLQEGSYFLISDGAGEDQLVTLKSANFTLAGDGIITFKFGIAGNTACYVALCDAKTNVELIKVTNDYFADPTLAQVLLRRVIYANDYIGREVYIKIVDGANSGFGFLNFDDLKVSLTMEEAQKIINADKQWAKTYRQDVITSNAEMGGKTKDIINAIRDYYSALELINVKSVYFTNKISDQAASAGTEDITQYLSEAKGSMLGVQASSLVNSIVRVSDGTVTVTSGFESFNLEAGKSYTVTYRITDPVSNKYAESTFVIVSAASNYEIINGDFEMGNFCLIYTTDPADD